MRKILSIYKKRHSRGVFELQEMQRAVRLRDIHATISEDSNTEEELVVLPANRLFSFIRRNSSEISRDHIVTLVFGGLRDLYFERRDLLSPRERISLDVATHSRLVDITYDETSEEATAGNVTPFDVLRLTVGEFVDFLNSKESISLSIDSIGVEMIVEYKRYDFWDEDSNRLVETVDLEA